MACRLLAQHFLGANSHPIADRVGDGPDAAAESGESSIGNHAVVVSRPRRGSPMGFVGLVAAEEVDLFVTFFDRSTQAEDG